jgi:hypothetical protein
MKYTTLTKNGSSAAVRTKFSLSILSNYYGFVAEVYDVSTSRLMNEIKRNGTPKNPVLLRNDIAIRVANNGAYDVTDLRMNLTKPVAVQPRDNRTDRYELNVLLNASDSYIYISNNSYIEISDMRNLTKPIWISPLQLVSSVVKQTN